MATEAHPSVFQLPVVVVRARVTGPILLTWFGVDELANPTWGQMTSIFHASWKAVNGRKDGPAVRPSRLPCDAENLGQTFLFSILSKCLSIKSVALNIVCRNISQQSASAHPKTEHLCRHIAEPLWICQSSASPELRT